MNMDLLRLVVTVVGSSYTLLMWLVCNDSNFKKSTIFETD